MTDRSPFFVLGLAFVLGACAPPGGNGLLPVNEQQELDPTAAGAEVFDDSRIHTIDLGLGASDWQAIIDAADAYENVNAKFPYARARVSFDGEELAGDIGVRLKGHISIELTEGHSFPLKLDFDRYTEDQSLDGLRKLNLNTNFNGPPLPILRDWLSYESWRQFGVAASRTAFARVRLNDEELGIYVMVEQVDGDFIEREFDAPYGDLYKPEQQTGSMEYRGDDIEDYPDIGHKWPGSSDHASLLAALAALDSRSLDEVERAFDVEGVLTYLAGNVVLGSWDSYPYTGHNYYLYEEVPGRFTMLPWDMNGSQEAQGLTICSPVEGLLSGLILQEPGWQGRYLQIASEFLEGPGSATWLEERLDRAQGLLGSALREDEVEVLRGEIRARTEALHEALAIVTGCP